MKNMVLKLFTTGLVLASSLFGSELVLLDTSGSMHGARDSANKMVQQLLDRNIKVIAFNDKITQINSISDIEYENGSDLGKALEYVYLYELPKGVTYLNIITDGDPGDRYKTLKFGTYLKDKGVIICSVSVNTSDIPIQIQKISKKALSTTYILKARSLCRGVRKNVLNEISMDIDENRYNLF